MICKLCIINGPWTLSFRLNSKGGILFYNQCYLSSFVLFTPNVPYTIYNQCYLNSFVSFEHNMMCAIFKIFIINVTWTLSFRLNTKCCILPMINVTWTLSDQKLGFRAAGSKVKGLGFTHNQKNFPIKHTAYYINQKLLWAQWLCSNQAHCILYKPEATMSQMVGFQSSTLHTI